MLESLKDLFKNIKLSWIDSIADIDVSSEFYTLISIFPNLKKIFQEAREENKDEIQRTIRHIFRSFKIFFLIESGKFYHETLSEESVFMIREKVLEQHNQNKLIIPILLMYHDIGRYIDNKNHPYHSYHLISTMKLLETFELAKNEKLLVRKLIHYHLLIATIFTGESTFYGIYSLLNDPEFTTLISEKKEIDRFLGLLEVFTYIDILGYFYTKIYDHYIKYYEEISSKLKIILNIWPNRELALEKAIAYSQEWLEWRLASALRIFQFVETQPHLTKEFYYSKLKESIKEINFQLLKDLNWDSLKDHYLINNYKIQLRYSLAFLMILAFGGLQRMGLKINTGISYKLMFFWILLSKEIEIRSKNNSKPLWNVYLEGMPHWSKFDKNLIEKINTDKIEFIIHNANHKFDGTKEEFTLYLDFNLLFD